MEFHSVHMTNIIKMIKLRRMRWAGHIAHTWDTKNACNNQVGKREGKRLFWRHKYRWEDNTSIRITLTNTKEGWELLSSGLVAVSCEQR